MLFLVGLKSSNESFRFQLSGDLFTPSFQWFGRPGTDPREKTWGIFVRNIMEHAFLCTITIIIYKRWFMFVTFKQNSAQHSIYKLIGFPKKAAPQVNVTFVYFCADKTQFLNWFNGSSSGSGESMRIRPLGSVPNATAWPWGTEWHRKVWWPFLDIVKWWWEPNSSLIFPYVCFYLVAKTCQTQRLSATYNCFRRNATQVPKRQHVPLKPVSRAYKKHTFALRMAMMLFKKKTNKLCFKSH